MSHNKSYEHYNMTIPAYEKRSQNVHEYVQEHGNWPSLRLLYQLCFYLNQSLLLNQKTKSIRQTNGRTFEKLHLENYHIRIVINCRQTYVLHYLYNTDLRLPSNTAFILSTRACHLSFSMAHRNPYSLLHWSLVHYSKKKKKLYTFAY